MTVAFAISSFGPFPGVSTLHALRSLGSEGLQFNGGALGAPGVGLVGDAGATGLMGALNVGPGGGSVGEACVVGVGSTACAGIVVG